MGCKEGLRIPPDYTRQQALVVLLMENPVLWRSLEEPRVHNLA